MSLIDRFAKPISEARQARGRSLFHGGAVEIAQTQNASLLANVTDDQSYTTTLNWESPDLNYSCTCGRAEHAPCEHVVAAALAADAEELGEQQPQQISPTPPPTRETQPRRRERGAVWLSPSGELKRLHGEDEPRRVVHHQPSAPSWKKQLARLCEMGGDAEKSADENWPPGRQILYVIDVPASAEQHELVIRLAVRDRRSDGEWSKPKTRGVSFPEVTDLEDPLDQQILAMLRGASNRREFHPNYDPTYMLPAKVRRPVLKMICESGRALLRSDIDQDELNALHWDDRPWEFVVDARRDDSTQHYIFSGWLRRDDQRVPLSRALLIPGGGVGVIDGLAVRIDGDEAIGWIRLLRQQKNIRVPYAQSEELLAELFSMPSLPRLELPAELNVETAHLKPLPILRVRPAKRDESRPDRLRAEIAFDYDGTIVAAGTSNGRVIYQKNQRRLIFRDSSDEKAAFAKLRRLGLRESLSSYIRRPEFWFAQRHLPRVVRLLVDEGWRVETSSTTYRRADRVNMRVSSGIDWLELRGEVNYGGQSVGIPQLLAALRRGETSVRLDDGTHGMLPEAWLQRYGLIASMGQEQDDHIQFSKDQVGLLDAMLASQPDVEFDNSFAKMREELHRFERIDPVEAPPTFVGELRHYQKDGLGWFAFLRQFGFGGCLADDMGLGKTIQVLAELEARRLARNGNAQSPGTSLVVVPKSLVFNWKQEAQRFTPDLKVLDHTGPDRPREIEALRPYDLVLTTYGTLRRDALMLKDASFDYVVLDEAQAIKNPASESAKAARLLRGRHRLVLSGTPVQNHLGDLWSLFDFLNPGMLGAASVFTSSSSQLRAPDDATREMLSRALRPFILRRTKDQVASELPPRFEQTIYCELESEQRQLYNELRDHYRASLLAHVGQFGLGRSKMQILEALLRLRQAALHPGLVDKSRGNESSAKLDMLIPRLAEVIDEGHKALVFSQFTSMLAIVRSALDRERVEYEYLDGKTTDREAHVRRFQEDPDCKLFLISLKAGGLGLNLTAADYVFLLDPWWNPAIEQQAIDRAHRIGQTRQVYACRLIARDTVEEKVLSLQQSKRELADAIITADNSLIRTLGRDDLELLLS